ncbi:SusC/RagA family TonB-linked outer membrane protein [Bacteroidales bacterium OttesenSCG-928-M11]|nr:SusC/RagA family TonB-linked outer membrane protein [Bacteroidales bacterium OttesenSCG-928-M11]
MKKYNLIKSLEHFLVSQVIMRGFGVVCMLLFTLSIQAQNAENIVVTGTVTDAATNEPLMGARVSLADNPSYSVMADELGNFTMKLSDKNTILLFSMPDYVVREIPVQGKTEINAQLYPDHFKTEYKTVEVLSGTDRKTYLLNSVNTASDFDNTTSVSVETEIQKQLGGSVRTITRSGTPGVGASMFVRGLNSLNANAQPLILVDGIVYDLQLNSSSIHQGFYSNPLTNIDMNDIESVSVIKDGNSIYGSKAANGIISIKTKRGIDMTTKITANFSFGVNEKPSLPDMMNAEQYRIYASNQVEGWYNYNNKNVKDYADDFRFLDNDPTKSYYNMYHNNTDWSDEIYRNGFVQNYSVAVNGGDEVALYNFSMSYTQNEGTIEESSMERLNTRFNSDIKLSSKLFANVDVSVNRVTRDLSDDGVSSISSPGYISLIKAPILASHRYVTSTGEMSPKLSDFDEIDPNNPVSNPVAIVENALGTSSRIGFNIRANPYYKFTDNLILGTTFSYNFTRVKESFFIQEYGIAPRYLEGSSNTIIKNEVRDLAQRQSSVFSDTRINWNLNFDKTHNLALLGGFRYMSDSYESDIPRGYNTGNDNIKVLTTGLALKEITGENEIWKSMSWYLNADYDFQKKYFLTLTASADASSRFGDETDNGVDMFGVNWAIFPSASAGWLISSEEFMNNVSFVDLLKLRVSYGLTGNDDINSYAGRSYFQSVNYLGGAVGLQMASLQNTSIQWETTKKAGVGLDVNLFNDRLSLTADLYKSTTDNLLTQKMADEKSGFGYYWTNEGKLQNQGYEVSFNSRVVNTRDFTWELGASVGHYKNEILKLPEGDYTTDIYGGSILTSVGNPVGVFYGYKTDGVFATTAEVAEANNLYMIDKTGAVKYYGAGDVHFVDQNDDNRIDDNDKVIIGDPNPDIYGTINTKFKYKRVSLDALFTYSYGNDVYNYLRSQLESGASLANQTTAMVNRWTTEGQRTSMPKAVYGDPMGNNVFSDRWIEDGSYLRLKSLTLAYELPFNLTFLQGVTVWASANNLFTVTKYLGSDPEFSVSNSVLYQGIDAGLTAQGRSYFIGVKINL